MSIRRFSVVPAFIALCAFAPLSAAGLSSVEEGGSDGLSSADYEPAAPVTYSEPAQQTPTARATVQDPAERPVEVNVYVQTGGEASLQETEDHKTRRFSVYGLGPGYFFNLDQVEGISYNFTYGQVWDAHRHAAVRMSTDYVFNFNEDPGFLFDFTIGGQYYFSTGAVSPYVGGGFGFAWAADDSNSEFGFTLAPVVGVSFFRSSNAAFFVEGGYVPVFTGEIPAALILRVMVGFGADKVVKAI